MKLDNFAKSRFCLAFDILILPSSAYDFNIMMQFNFKGKKKVKLAPVEKGTQIPIPIKSVLISARAFFVSLKKISNLVQIQILV